MRFGQGWVMLALLAAPAVQAGEISVVPRPAQVTMSAGEGLILAPGARIVVAAGDKEGAEAARYLADLAGRADVSLTVAQGPARPGDIRIEGRKKGAAESYHLSVSDQGAVVSAKDGPGKFYGVVTLWQMLSTAPDHRLPAVEIEDAPRFAWRGLMLDSGRHFQSAAYVRHFIDWMALHKLNMFHWHLTDDQGWRIEIKRFPKLTSVGSVRPADGPERAGGPSYGGYYSQAEIKDIVAYAAARHVTIVPEIDMPGHVTAAVAAYPELGVPGFPVTEPSGKWGVLPSLLTMDEATFGAVEAILGEVMDLFPSPYIHIGGDEVAKQEWRDSPVIQKRMKELGIADEEALQGYFAERLQRFLDKRGRRLVGWDEILRGHLGKSAVVMSWRGREGAVAAAHAGLDTIMAAWPGYYLDARQGNGPDEPPGWTNILSLKDIYDIDPLPDGLDAKESAHLIGVQGQLWTERARTEEWVTRLTWPRAAAIAETGWSPAAGHDWNDFSRRMTAQRERYRLIGLMDGGIPAAPVPATGSRRSSLDLGLCRKDEIGVAMESDSGPPGARFMVDYLNPCWVYPSVDLGAARRVKLAVGQLAFAYVLGNTAPTVKVPPSRTPFGEIAIHLDAPDGPLLADVPLEGVSVGGQTREFAASLPAKQGRHDLYFVATGREIDSRAADPAPLTVIDWIDFDGSASTP